MKCVIAKWVPHILTAVMRENGVQGAKEMLEFYQTHRRCGNEGESFLRGEVIASTAFHEKADVFM